MKNLKKSGTVKKNGAKAESGKRPMIGSKAKTASGRQHPGKSGRKEPKESELATGKDLAVGHLELATGKSPEPAGNPAGAGCPTSDGAAGTNASGLKGSGGQSLRGRGRERVRGGFSAQRRRLVGILEEYDVSVTGFDGLRADTYEKHLARQSLTELEEFYARLLNTCEHYKKIQKQCLPWGDGSDDKGKLPSVRTLTVIKERILTERRLADMAPRLKAFSQVARSLTGLPVAERVVVLQGMQALIAAELMGLVGQGQRVMDHLPAVDRVIRAVSAQARVEQTAERYRLQEKALELRKAESEKRPMIGSKAKTRVEAEEEDLPVSTETPDEIFKRVYGKNPFADDQPEPANVTLDPKTKDEGKMTDANVTPNPKVEAEESATDDTEGTEDDQNSNDEVRMTNEADEAVETDEEYQQRRQEEYDRMWEARRRRIREEGPVYQS